MRYDLIFSSSELFQHQIQHKNKIKNYTQKLQKRFDLGFEKTLKSYFCRLLQEKLKKAPQAKIFVIRTVFTPKIAQKCKKMANRKFTPPVGGQEMYLFWESPRLGGITEKSPPYWGGFTPSYFGHFAHIAQTSKEICAKFRFLANNARKCPFLLLKWPYFAQKWPYCAHCANFSRNVFL